MSVLFRGREDHFAVHDVCIITVDPLDIYKITNPEEAAIYLSEYAPLMVSISSPMYMHMPLKEVLNIYCKQIHKESDIVSYCVQEQVLVHTNGAKLYPIAVCNRNNEQLWIYHDNWIVLNSDIELFIAQLADVTVMRFE